MQSLESIIADEIVTAVQNQTFKAPNIKVEDVDAVLKSLKKKSKQKKKANRMKKSGKGRDTDMSGADSDADAMKKSNRKKKSKKNKGADSSGVGGLGSDLDAEIAKLKADMLTQNTDNVMEIPKPVQVEGEPEFSKTIELPELPVTPGENCVN